MTEDEVKKLVEKEGCIYNGIQYYKGTPLYYMFTDNKTKSTMSLPIADMNADNVKRKIRELHAKYMIESIDNFLKCIY